MTFDPSKPISFNNPGWREGYYVFDHRTERQKAGPFPTMLEAQAKAHPKDRIVWKARTATYKG